MINDQTTRRLVGFVHHLRAQGFVIGIKEIIDTLSSVDTQALADINHSRHIIRSLTCQSQRDWERFDDLFLEYWLQAQIDPNAEPLSHGNVQGSRQARQTGFSGSAGEAPEVVFDEKGLKGCGAGKQSTISKADFRFLNDQSAMQQVEKLAERLAAKLNNRLRRRWAIQPKGRRMAIRQTIRRNLSYGGMPVHAFYQNRVREPIDLVVLHDVSHSMTWNNPLLFRFVRGIARTFKSAEVFPFHTHLFKATSLYRERSLETMQKKLEAKNHLWMGGTCIADSLRHFNQYHAPKTLNGKSVVVIISDGFDADEPRALAKALARIKKTSRKLIWLNPMIGREGYDPNIRTMQSAAPYIDRLASANNLDALEQTVQFIAQTCR